MNHHFGVLIPSTNTTTETEFSRLPPQYQAHYARLLTSTPGRPFSPGRDEDIDYQSKLLGTARVEMVVLIQTSASLFADDYDDNAMRRMSAGAGVPSITSALAIARALRALGVQKIGLVSPYSEAVNARARSYFSGKHGLQIVAVDGFAATDSYAIGQLEPEKAREAFARMDRPGIEAFVVPGANFPTLAAIPAWEREFGKPVITSSQAAVWAVARQLGGDPVAAGGRLLEQLPPERPGTAQ
jgi:maleate cis-trans isomerase